MFRVERNRYQVTSQRTGISLIRISNEQDGERHYYVHVPHLYEDMG
jgi:hypothetical protein